MKSEANKVTREMSKDGGGIELALAAVVFGLFGWWLDSKFATTPFLFIAFFLLGFIGSAVSAYYRYKNSYAKAEEKEKN